MRRNDARSRRAVAPAVPSGPLESTDPAAISQKAEASAENVSEERETSLGAQPSGAGPPKREVAKPSAPTSIPGLDVKVPPILFEDDEPTLPATKESGPKHALAPELQTGRSEPNRELLPESYDTGRLLLTARDPHALYLHWDVSADRQKQSNEFDGPGQLFVRLHAQGPSAPPITEIRVPGTARDWFIHAPGAGTQYVAELGYYESAQGWRVIGTSNSAQTPPEAVAEERSVQFATFPFDLPLAPPPASKHGEPLGADEPHPGQMSITPLSAIEALIRSAQMPPPTPLAMQEREPIAAATPTPGAGKEPVAAVVQGPASPEWTLQQERELTELIGWTPLKSEWPGSAEIPEVLRGHQVPLASPELVAPVSPEVRPISSPAGGEMPVEHGFWLNVNAELVIYGATQPNARLTLAGESVRLRPDGTFSFRFALPDGRFELPLNAASAQGEVRHVNLSFTRATVCQGKVGTHPQDPALNKPEPGSW